MCSVFYHFEVSKDESQQLAKEVRLDKGGCWQIGNIDIVEKQSNFNFRRFRQYDIIILRWLHVNHSLIFFISN